MVRFFYVDLYLSRVLLAEEKNVLANGKTRRYGLIRFYPQRIY